MRVILDTDVGLGTPGAVFDDGMAMILALNSTEMDIVGITTCHGNVNVDDAFNNAKRLALILGKEVNVLRGSEGPMDRSKETNDAADFIINTSEELSDLTIIALGPLTNIAMALRRKPEIAKRWDSVFVMGGAMAVKGNVTPYAEFNVYKDPLAAKILFSLGRRIILIPLDVTRKTALTLEDLDKFFDGSRPYDEYVRYHVKKGLERMGGMCHLHDPLAVAIALDREIVGDHKVGYVEVVTKGREVGRTVLRRDARGNVDVCLDINVERFMRLLGERV